MFHSFIIKTSNPLNSKEELPSQQPVQPLWIWQPRSHGKWALSIWLPSNLETWSLADYMCSGRWSRHPPLPLPCPPRGWLLIFINTSHLGALAVSQGHDRNLNPTSDPLNYQAPCLFDFLPVYLSVHLCPFQGFQMVCEAVQSDSSSPSTGEQSCRRGNSVEKGGPSQQPPPVKGPSKKKWAALIDSASSGDRGSSPARIIDFWFESYVEASLPFRASCLRGQEEGSRLKTQQERGCASDTYTFTAKPFSIRLCSH